MAAELSKMSWRFVEIRVTWPQAEPHRGEMRDLSLNGMLFVAPVALQPNQIVRVDCPELRALGRVAHVESDSDGGGARTGIEFLTLRLESSCYVVRCDARSSRSLRFSPLWPSMRRAAPSRRRASTSSTAA